MGDEAESRQKVIHREVEAAEGTQNVIKIDVACMVVSVVPIPILIWTTFTGFKFATESNSDGRYGYYAFSIGVFNIVVGSVFVIIGLAIVAADIALNLAIWLHPEEKIHIQQGTNSEARDWKRIGKGTALFIANVILNLMLLWVTYTGARLVTEPRPDGKYNRLNFSVGVVSIAFGSIYFIIGLALAAGSALNLSHMLMKEDKQRKEVDFYSFLCAENDDIV